MVRELDLEDMGSNSHLAMKFCGSPWVSCYLSLPHGGVKTEGGKEGYTPPRALWKRDSTKNVEMNKIDLGA